MKYYQYNSPSKGIIWNFIGLSAQLMPSILLAMES
jgi:hypothetical protein